MVFSLKYFAEQTIDLKQKIIDLKKFSWQKVCNIISLFFLKIGLGRPIDEQINLFLPKGTEDIRTSGQFVEIGKNALNH